MFGRVALGLFGRLSGQGLGVESSLLLGYLLLGPLDALSIPSSQGFGLEPGPFLGVARRLLLGLSQRLLVGGSTGQGLGLESLALAILGRDQILEPLLLEQQLLALALGVALGHGLVCARVRFLELAYVALVPILRLDDIALGRVGRLVLGLLRLLPSRLPLGLFARRGLGLGRGLGGQLGLGRLALSPFGCRGAAGLLGLVALLLLALALGGLGRVALLSSALALGGAGSFAFETLRRQRRLGLGISRDHNGGLGRRRQLLVLERVAVHRRLGDGGPQTEAFEWRQVLQAGVGQAQHHDPDRRRDQGQAEGGEAREDAEHVGGEAGQLDHARTDVGLLVSGEVHRPAPCVTAIANTLTTGPNPIARRAGGASPNRRLNDR